MLSFLRRPPAGRPAGRPARCRLALESLENRTVPYALSGYTWANPNVSVSFMPDGTLISSSYPSDLLAVYDAAYPRATWQREVARALQSWADVSNLNFHFVADDGSPQGTSGLAQGDNRFGDIRIGGYDMGAGILGLGWSPGGTTTAGDVELSTGAALAIGAMPDLASVVMHEAGHGVGFNHSLAHPAVMEGGLWGTYPGPYADDVAGVQAMYGARRPDAYDAAAANDTLAAATALPLTSGGASVSGDITTTADVDNYRAVVPAGSDGTLTVSVDARGLSLFAPKVSVFDASGTLVATASASTYGGVATVSLSGLVAGQTYYLRAAGATADVFGMGAYKMTAQFGGPTSPPAPAPAPDRFEANNTAATATNLGTLTGVNQTGLSLHTSTDVDYFTAAAGSKATFTVSVTPTQGSGTLGLTVLNAQQAVLASGQSQTGGVTVSVGLASGQQYYVKVWSPTGGVFSYDLSVAKAGTTGGGGGTKGGHHLVFTGFGYPDDAQPEGDFFYQNAAADPDDGSPSRANPGDGPSHAPTAPVGPAIGTTLGVASPAAATPGDPTSQPAIRLYLAPPAAVPPPNPPVPDPDARIAPLRGLWPPGAGSDSDAPLLLPDEPQNSTPAGRVADRVSPIDGPGADMADPTPVE